MAELVANFTLSEGVEFDTVFQINATPTKVSQLENDLNYQTDTQVAESIDEAATTINNRIDDINNTLQGYGNIVTHNVSEFATSAQGALADTALQPNDNITELVNNAGYITSASVGSANLTIQRNGTALGTFNANATEPLTVNISVPTTATDVGALPSDTTINDLTTTAQQNALNSGATTTNIGQIATNTSAITTINGKIPSQASSSNQLADKSFVNSSIATNTANFIGTFNSVAELEAYSGTLTNNDYAFVVTTDSAGNTLYDRYKYNGSEWLFEYELNNSSFTASQWSAINSGITSSDVTLIGTAIQPNDNITELNNNAGYITCITSSDVTTALGYTPYNSSNPSGYQANVIETVKVNGTALTPSSKAVDITVPTNNNQLTNGAGYITSSALTPYALSADLSTVATSGSYNDLSNKPNLSGYQTTSNLVTTVSASSTDAQYPSAKLFYDTCGDIETLINAL